MQPLPMPKTLTRLDLHRVHYAPGEDEAHTTELGLARLREMAPDLPVYLVRLERGIPIRCVRESPMREGDITPKTLVPGVTGFAAAFEVGGQSLLVVASLTPLTHPLPDGSNFPYVPGAFVRAWK